MRDIKEYIEIVATVIEVAGVLTVIIGMGLAFYRFGIRAKNDKKENSYTRLRQQLGKSILLGLEILVAGDIVATVSFDPTMERVLILGLIVLIRTFLSISIEVEIEGRFPWQKKEKDEETI